MGVPILIVDDKRVNRLVLRKTLASERVEKVARDGRSFATLRATK